jgi:tripartite-type tricarboxylate transporter receptor subunit TctC
LVKITRRNLLAASAAFAVTPVLAQPAKNMTLVVPFPPGGSTDALARLLQSHLQTKLGRTVLVENKSGAAGSLGAIQVAKSAPDGATFLVTFDSHAVIPSILEKPGLDVEKDLVPVFLVGTAPRRKRRAAVQEFCRRGRGLQGKSRCCKIRLRRHRHARPSGDDGARKEGGR